MFDRFSSPERRALGCVFAAACLAFCAWAFPNMTQYVTIPGAVICAGLAIFFLLPEIIKLFATKGGSAFLKAKLPAAMAILGVIAVFCLSGWYVYSITPWNRDDPINNNPARTPVTVSSIISRDDRLVFSCDAVLPLPQKMTAKRKAEYINGLENEARDFAETLGLSVISISEISNGLRGVVEASTDEAKRHFASVGIIPGVTRITIEERQIRGRTLVDVFSDLPKGQEIYSLLVPNPQSEQIRYGEKIIAEFLLAKDDACRLY